MRADGLVRSYWNVYLEVWPREPVSELRAASPRWLFYCVLVFEAPRIYEGH